MKKLLLHICCAPCCGGVVETLLKEKVDFSLFFYNPNIYPESEYLKRKAEVIEFCKKHIVSYVDGDFDVENWEQEIRGLESEPERGKRCSVCFEQRLSVSAKHAISHNFTHLATTLGISRWKDIDQVNRALVSACQNFKELTPYDRNWRKKGGVDLMHKVSKDENFYRQTYCGCRFSLTNPTI